MNKIDNVVNSHLMARKHLKRVTTGLNEEQWFQISGKWSIQRAATHIINAELYWMGLISETGMEYLSKEATYEEFLEAADKVSEFFISKVQEEGEIGFKGKNTAPTYVWSMLRTTQHCIYHTGMISQTRQIVNAPALEGGDTWQKMVDSLFEGLIHQN
jgi:uncharacterized damage-inducible protein DinB